MKKQAFIISTVITSLFLAGLALAAPTSTYVQNLFITGLPSAPCLTTGANGLVASTTCGGSGSGSVSTSSPITAGYFPFWTSSTGQLAGTSTIFTTGGNVGIGTTAPSSTLHVVGSGNTGATQPFKVTNSDGTQILAVRNDGVVQIYSNITSAASFVSAAATGFSNSLWTNGVERLTVASSGNVGIGTVTPAAPLDVNGNLIMRGTSLSLGATSTRSLVTSNTSFGLASGVNFQWSGTTDGGGTKDASLSRAATGVLAVGTGLAGTFDGTLAAGSIGIGTTAPSSTLHIVSTSTATSSLITTQTWNSASTVFTPWLLDITDTTSSASSLLFNMKVGGASMLSLTKTGDLLDPSGNKYVTSTVSGGGSVSTSSAITANNFPFWTSTSGGLSGTSTLTTSGGVLTQTGALAITSNASATALGLTGTGGAGFLTFIGQSSSPTSPPAGTALLHATTNKGYTRIEQDNEATVNTVLGRDSVFIAKNTSGVTLSPGQAVYVNGSTGNVPNVAKAQANSTTTLPVAGVVMNTIANNAFGQIMMQGIISDIDTSAFTTGDQVYVSPTASGTLTNVRPTQPNLVAKVGIVMVSGVGNGSLFAQVAPFIGGIETGTNFSGTYLFAGGVNVTSTLTVGATTTLSQLTASRLMGTGASKQVVSITDLTTYIAGTASEVTVANDGDGSVTVSLPTTVDLGASSNLTTVGLNITNGTSSGNFQTATLKATGAVNASSTATVEGATTLRSTLTQSGGVVSLASTTVNGNATTTMLTVTGTSTLLGNVGIGTSTPTSNLYVIGASGQSTDLLRVASSSATNFITVSATGTTAFDDGITGTSTIQFGAPSQPACHISYSFIATTTPVYWWFEASTTIAMRTSTSSCP